MHPQLVRLSCFPSEMTAEFMVSASLICLGMVISTKEKQRENARLTSPECLCMVLQLSPCLPRLGSSVLLPSTRSLPCTAFHPADAKAIVWMNVILSLPEGWDLIQRDLHMVEK